MSADDKFDFGADEPSTLPPMPSRPAIEPDPPALAARLVSALGGETSDVALLPQEVRNLRAEVRDGFKTLGERILPTLERLERMLSDHHTRIVEGEHRTRALDDRLSRQERDMADHAARIHALEQAAAKRLRRK